MSDRTSLLVCNYRHMTSYNLYALNITMICVTTYKWKTNYITENIPTAITLVVYILFISMTGWTAIDTKSFTSLASAIPRPYGWLEIEFFRNMLL